MKPLSSNSLCRLSFGFSLIEMLTVLAIISVLSAVTVPMIGSLVGSGSMDKVVSDLGNQIELARSYAMANQTYVRMGFAYNTGSPQSLVSAFFSPTDGTLQSGNMADSTAWSTISRISYFPNVEISDQLNAQSPDTNDDARLTDSLVTTVPGQTLQGTQISFEQNFLQFAPSGEITLAAPSTVNGSTSWASTPFRYLSIGLRSRQIAANEAIVRVSGYTGSVQTLRSENGVR
jgi:prepilin-type N-terminal cleavage/methylation domain-containing protein